MLTDPLNETLERVINHGISASTTASALCGSLSGSRFAVRITGTGARFRLSVHEERIFVDQEAEADVEVAGSPLALAKLFGSPGAPLRDGSVELTGDAALAAQFSDLLRMALPDPEEELSRITGDAVAREAGDAARGALRRIGAVTETLARSLGEYLQEEKRTLPSRADVEEFMAGVDELANDVARLQARLAIISEQGDGPRDKADDS